MTIEIIIFVLLIIINAKTTNFEIAPLIASLITLENEKSLILLLNDFHFRAFISIIKEGDEVFTVIMITECYETTNVEMNQVQRSLPRANVNLIKCLTCLLDSA